MYRNKTFKLKQVYYEQVTPVWNTMKLQFPQECSEMENRDVPSTMNCLHTSNDGSETQAGTFTVDTDVRNGKSNKFTGINNNLRHKDMNITNSKSKSLEFLLTNCSKCMCSIHKKMKQNSSDVPVLFYIITESIGHLLESVHNVLIS
jgi:hypothetical protein